MPAFERGHTLKQGWPLSLTAAFALAASGCAAPPSNGLLRHHHNGTGSPVGKSAEPAAPAPEVTEPVLDDTATLQDYLAYAAMNNAGLEAAFNRWRTAIERVPQVESLPDPRFTYRFYIKEVETRLGPMEQGAGLSQTFPWFGKLDLRGCRGSIRRGGAPPVRIGQAAVVL